MEKKLTPWQKYKQNLGEARPWDLLSSEMRTTYESASDRLKICLECPELIQATKQCKKCGCLMTLKTKLSNAVCPLGKW